MKYERFGTRSTKSVPYTWVALTDINHNCDMIYRNVPFNQFPKLVLEIGENKSPITTATLRNGCICVTLSSSCFYCGRLWRDISCSGGDSQAEVEWWLILNLHQSSSRVTPPWGCVTKLELNGNQPQGLTTFSQKESECVESKSLIWLGSKMKGLEEKRQKDERHHLQMIGLPFLSVLND